MSNGELRYVSYVVLALVGEGGASAHDIVRMIRQGGRIYGDPAPSQLYSEPKRLAKLGYLTARRERGQTTDRTRYGLTRKGRSALRAYLREPSPFPRLQQEATLRLLAGDMISDEEIVASLEGMRAEIAELTATVAEMEAHAPLVPHRTRYLQLQHALARRLLRTYTEWIDDVAAALRPAREPE